MNDLTRIQLLEIDLDVRLHELWAEADVIEEWNLPTVAAFLRAAYGAGYMHALSESERGELCRTHNYKVPVRGDLRRAA